jgi:P27 family predicted phage terminase small subunit
MGRRGPKPEAAAIKEKKGNPGHRPIGSDPSPQKDAAKKIAVSPPSWLKAGKGLEVWKRLAPRLISLKLLTTTDVETFGRYCRSCARWLQMQQKIDKQGLTRHVKSNHGEWDRPHPLLLPSDRLEVRLQAFEACFGLNPADRQRIFAARATTPDPAARDLFGDDTPAGRPDDMPAKPARQSEGPIGLLN